MAEDDYCRMVNKLPAWRRLVVKIRTCLTPWYRYEPSMPSGGPLSGVRTRLADRLDAWADKSEDRSSRASVDLSEELSDVGSALPDKAGKPHGVRIRRYSKPLSKAIHFSTKPAPGTIWTYHDNRRHQVFAHLTPGSGFAYKGRSNAARKRLKPLVYPTDVGVFDRTHLLPIGYHGSESDPRLLVGWDSADNQGPFNEFEKRQKKRKGSIYWLASVIRTNDGARWDYRVYDTETEKMIDSLTATMNAQFVWKD